MTVRYENPSDFAGLITLNRPQSLNAFDKAMRADLLAALKKSAADQNVRVVVLTGEGRGFSAGADLMDAAGAESIEDILNTEYSAVLSAIQTMDKPVIAAINGPAAGIGMALALTCDLRVMAEDAYMMCAFSNIGLVPDGGLSFLLTRELGYARAYQLAVEAEKISAERCLALGLVNRLAAPGSAREEALLWAGDLARRAPLALAATKKTFRAAAQNGLDKAMALEASLQGKLAATEDCREGVSAMFEKRRPVFKGR